MTARCLRGPLFVEGVACIGKSTVVGKFKNSAALDYYDAVKEEPRLRSMYHSTLPCDFFNLWQLGRLRDDVTVADRSPFSTAIYKIVNDYNDEFMAEFESLLEGNWFRELAVNIRLLIVLPREKHYDSIVDKMKERNNGIDHYAYEYVERQVKAYELFAAKTGKQPRYIPEDMEMFTEEYFSWFENLIKDNVVVVH